jgi:hypothetical protein
VGSSNPGWDMSVSGALEKNGDDLRQVAQWGFKYSHKP